MNDGDFDAKPMVLLIGQYSVGKTSFIRYLLGRDFPNQHIGPEPTTDRFIVVMYGDREKVTPGNALTSQPDTPFHSLPLWLSIRTWSSVSGSLWVKLPPSSRYIGSASSAR